MKHLSSILSCVDRLQAIIRHSVCLIDDDDDGAGAVEISYILKLKTSLSLSLT